MLADVVARLRAGGRPGVVWTDVLAAGLPPVPAGPAGAPPDLTTSDGVPTVAALTAATVGARAARGAARAGRGGRRRRGSSPDLVPAAAVVAACRLAHDLGAPVADVLDRVAAAVVLESELEGERRAAVAGPRSSARLLAALPLLGLAVGVLLGADPVAVVVGGGPGAAAVGAGFVLLVLGHRWTAHLVRAAERAGAR
ncbi:type II secretion protein F [Cellulomonas endophytica]|uniref:type II secretion protein F n=1 Tax=Cellulomonas endophytica TaxID=2494735 RepID=UPI001F0B846B|nr:type II secretion protein F [Cellulomonas endophytica]